MMAAETASAQKDAEPARRTPTDATPDPALTGGPAGAVAAGWLGHEVLSHPANAGVRTLAMRRAQQTQGNLYVQRIASKLGTGPRPGRAIQRQCSCGGSCAACRAPGTESAPATHEGPEAITATGDEHRIIQSKTDLSGQSGPPAKVDLFPPGGEPLDSQTRRLMESRFGADFGNVRVHADSRAGEAASAIGANAYTSGREIYFGPGKYATTTEGQHLLAHELTHTIQQGGASTTNPPDEAVVSRPDDPSEREADAVADHVMRRSSPAPMGVMQQTRSGAESTIQRQFWGHTQHPNQPAFPHPPDPYPSGIQCDQHALAAMHSETVELKGTSEFRPSEWLAEGLRCAGPSGAWVRVRFGTLASGRLHIRMNDPPSAFVAPGSRGPLGTYQTVEDHPYRQSIELTHPAFPGAGNLAPPRMSLTIQDSVVTGFVSFVPQIARISFEELPALIRAQTLENVLGWRGLVDVRPAGGINEVRDGVLRFALQDFAFGMRDLQALEGVSSEQADYTGTGNFSVTDEKTSFSAEAVIKAEGMSEARMPLHRAQGRIFGAASFGLTLAPRDAFGGKFSGSLQGTYANGVMSITGTARYRSQKLNGSVTVLVAPRSLAWMEVLKRLPAGAPPITAGTAMAPGHVVVGWGAIDFRINEWLTGEASVVVDPDGYITSHGILRPTVEHRFLDEPGRYEAVEPIAHAKLTKTLDTVLVANLNGSVTMDVKAGGRIGPVRLYGLEVEGQFSTRPGTIFTGRITGRANLSAQASIGAKISGKLNASLGPTADVSVDVLSVGVDIDGQATLRAYVELQPTFERLAGGKPDEATYKISGTLTAGGAVSLGLRGSIGFSIPGYNPKIEVFKFQYPLGGVSIETTFSHVLGSNQPIEITKPKLGDFNDEKYTGFMQDLFEKKAPKSDKKHDFGLDQPTGTIPPKEAAKPTQLIITFTMNGKPHTLWLDHTGGPVLKMASDGDDSLDTKLRNEIALVEQQRQAQEGDEAELLGDEAQSARSLLIRSMAVERSLGELESEKRQNPDAAGFNELASGLTAYADQFGKEDLAQSSPPGAIQPAAAPGRSAPGIGRIGFHGSKPPSLRKGPEIWWLESEHIIPFATGKQLWDVLGLVVPGRGGHEDRGQTTIMIYYEAARFKTPVDNEISDAFKSKIASIDAVERMRRARRLIEAGQPEAARAEVEDILHLMFKALSAARDDAVERTNDAIVSESNMKMEGSSQTNAERRGRPGKPEDALPDTVQVEDAATRQQNDIINLATQELEAANILR